MKLLSCLARALVRPVRRFTAHHGTRPTTSSHWSRSHPSASSHPGIDTGAGAGSPAGIQRLHRQDKSLVAVTAPTGSLHLHGG